MKQMTGSTVTPYGGHTPKIGQDCFLASGAHLIGDLEVGEACSFWFNTVVRADCNIIRIGDRVNVQDGTVIHVTAGTGPTHIGSNVTIGHSAIIHACTIADDVLVGMGATILDGAQISSNCFVAANALVPPGRDYPEGKMIMGSPAKAIRDVTDEELRYIRESAIHYVEYALGYL